MAISKSDVEKAKGRVVEATKDLTQSKTKEFVRKSITIDKVTLDKISRYQEKRGLDFSSAVRVIINEFLDNR